MKVADAITAIERALRDGRAAALRRPSRTSARTPRPCSTCAGGRRYRCAADSSPATSIRAAARKNAPDWGIRPLKPALIDAMAAAAAAIASAPTRPRPAATEASPPRVNSPASSARADICPRLRSDHHVQAMAAATPPTTPTSSGAGATCNVIAVVPTASTHRVPRSRTMSAAYPTAPAAPSESTEPGEHRGFPQELPADERRPGADGVVQPHLAHALLHAELEEQRRQHQRRDHEKEAEVDEILAEVRDARRCGERLRADVANGKAGDHRID